LLKGKENEEVESRYVKVIRDFDKSRYIISYINNKIEKIEIQ
jgi:hypothetical protein